MSVQEQYDLLIKCLKTYPGAVVAFSGGTDSSVLLAAAHAALGNKATAVTWQTEVVPDSEIDAAMKIAAELEVSHRLISESFLENETAAANPRDRCYHCRKQMYTEIKKLIGDNSQTVIMEGVNLDDLNDFRPGLKAAEEMGVVHPFVDAKLTKKDIRAIAAFIGLPYSEKEAAPCLASRVAYGIRITSDRLRRIEIAEEFLKSRGFRHVRVRLIDDILARIEVSADQVNTLREDFMEVNAFMCGLDFARVEIDEEGYKMGKMNG
jgi:pyridinium-3,5-biscarboxylic acid mononucleotide sulfurtransferase